MIKRTNFKLKSDKNIKWFQDQDFSLLFDNEKYKHPTSNDIKELRLFTGWSQTEIANILGVAVKKGKGSSTVRKWLCREETREHRKIPFSAWRLLLISAGIVDQSIYINNLNGGD